MKNSLISRFVMLFLFVFGCGTMSPIPALAGGDSYEVDFYCADGSLATLPNGNGAIIFLEDGFDCSAITVPTSCDGKTVLSWKDTQHSAGTNILSQDVCDYAQYIFNNGIDSFISLKPETYESVTFTVEYCFPLEHTQASFDECLWNKICDICDQITIDATYCPDRASYFDYSSGNNVTSYYVPALDTKVSPTDIGQCELLYAINESGNSDHRLIESSWTDYSTGDIVPIGYKRVKFYNNSGAYVTYRDYDMSVYEGNLPTASSLGISAPSGKSFYGWTFAGDSNCSIDFGVISTSDTIVEALSACSGNTYTAHPAYADNVNVVFYANGGSGSAPTSYTCNMKSCILPSNPYTRTGYTFTGWLVEDGSINFTGADYIAQPGTNIVSKFGANQADVSITLTAQWKQSCNAITIKGSTRGGSGTYKIYKKTGSSTVYSNSTCTTAITSVPAAMSTSVTKTNAMFAGTTNDCIKVTETTQDNVSLSFNTASTCNVTAATTWDARFYCNSYWRGSGKNLTGACTGSGVNFVYFKDSSKSNAVASQHCVYGSGCYTYNINDLYGVKVGYTAGSYLYDCLSGSWAADNLCDGNNNNPTTGQIPEETSLSDYVTQYIDNFMADNYTQDTIYGDTVLNIGLYPYWIEAANTLEVYQSASATTAYSTVSCPYGSDASVCLPTDKRPSKTGYTLVGFCRGKTDSCTDVIGLDGTELSTLASGGTTIQLTAKWNPNTYTITLNQDGGKGGQSSVTVVSGQVPPTLTSLPTKDGYTFGGYGIYSEGKEEWQSVYYNADGTGNGEYSSASDITLYAIWEPKAYDVTLYANGCTGYPKTIQMTQGQTMSILPSAIDDCDSCGALSGWYDVANPDENSLLIMSSDTYRNDVHGTEFYALFVSVKTPCSAGYYLPKGLAGLGSEVCVECPAGSYCGGGELECSNGGDVGIASCPNGYTSDKGVADSIEDCYISIPAGKYLDTAKSATLKDCPAGYYCPAQSKVYYGKISDKKSCSAGTYSDTTDAASCTSCPAGYYCPDNNMTSPTVCSGNTYSNAKGAKTCTSCPTGYSISGTEYTNHDAKSDCTISCGAGTYVKTADGACVNAGVGYYMAAHTVAAGTTETPNQCPNGGTTSGETTSAIASCYKVLSGCTVSGVTGTGKKTCYYTSGSGINAVYNNRCTVCAIDNCPTGYELVNGTCSGKTYTITLNDNGGSGGLRIVKEVYNTRWTNSASETITTVTVPVRSGYSFNGYYTSATGGTRRIDATGALPSNTTFTANTPLYAQWTPKSYTIKYYTSGKLGEQDCTYGESCIVGQAVAGAVTQTGATFNGIWTNDEVPCGTGSMEQGKDMNVDYLTCSAAFADANNDELPVLKADFTPNTYYVKYDANGGTGTIGNTTCTYGTVCRLTESGFTKDGYTLLGWSLSKTATTATYTDKATNLTETNGATITLYAVWGSCTPCTTSVGAYCYLDTSNGICEYNSGCNTGYSKQSGSTDAKPLCSPNLMKLPVYKTILDANNNAIPVTYINVYYNSKVPETFDTSVFSRSGYSIAGISGIGDYCTGVYYDGDGNRYSDRTVMDTGCKFYADWTANTYAVTLDSPDAYDHGTAVVYYKYEQDEDCIYYADINAEQCLSENKGTKIKAPARVGYSFRGYYTGNGGTGTEYVDDTGTISETLYSTVADNSTLYADWEEQFLTVYYYCGDDGMVWAQECSYANDTCILTDACEKKVGHVNRYSTYNEKGEGIFVAENAGLNIFDQIDYGLESIEVYGGPIPISYTLKIVDTDGTTLKTQNCEYGTDCDVPNVTKPGYLLAGYVCSGDVACDGNTIVEGDEFNGDYIDESSYHYMTVTLTAQWNTQPITIHYQCDGSTDSATKTCHVTDEKCILDYTGCTKTGHTLDTWTIDADGYADDIVGTGVDLIDYGFIPYLASDVTVTGFWDDGAHIFVTPKSWNPNCYKVEIEYSYNGQIDYSSYYIKHGDSSMVYSDVQCTQETYIDQYDTGYDSNGDFVGLYDDDDNMCMDDTGELSGDCLADGDGYTWTALYLCDGGYTAHGDTVWAGDICSNCYQVKLSPAEGYSDADFLYTDGTENYVDAMCQNPYQGIIAPDKENATWVGYTNRSWDKNYTGEYPTDALCTSDESQGANTGKCAVTDNNQTWTAVYKCNDGYTANGTYVDYNTECSQNVYSVDLVYYCVDPTGAGDESTPPEKPSVCYSNRTCIMPENSCSYEGYQFTGWRVNCDTCGDNSKIYVQPGDDISWQINFAENRSTWDVDAMWKPNTYTVTLDANGGTGGATSVNATYGSAMPSATMPMRPGYMFSGYYDTNEETGGTSYYTSSGASVRNWDKTSATTLYARWTLCPSGAYCPGTADNNSSVSCPKDTANRTSVSTPAGSDSATDCYVTCPSTKIIANARTVVVVDETPNYNGSSYPYCTYNVTCNDGYSVQYNSTPTPSCTPNTYTVAYDNNDGTGTMSNQSRTYNDGAKLTANTFTRTGYTFAGWNTAADGTGTSYGDQATGNLTSTNGATVTLYAQWGHCVACSTGTGATCSMSVTNNTCTYTTACLPGYNTLTNNGKYNPSCTANTYTVAYDANGGTGATASSSHTYDVSKALTANGFTNGTKKFLGWSTSKTATSATYTNKQSVKNLTETNKGTVTLYAIWSDCQACSAGTGASCTLSAPLGVCTYTTACKTGYNTLTNSGKYNPSCTANTYTVAYDANDGTGTMNNQSRTYNDGAKLTANTFTRTGYTFVGWNTKSDGTGTSYANQATGNLTSTNGATVTLYAQWGQCQACSAGTGATCSISVTNNTCIYTTACKTGYNTLINSGKYNPSCTANTYTVTYSCGDGDGTAPKSTTATYDSVFTMAQNTCSKTGYDFVEWKSSDTVYQAEQKFNWTYLENKTFVAQWSAKHITCQSGEFLDITSCVPCSVGFKCPATSVTYTYNADIQGRTACSGTSQYQNQTGQTVCKTVDDGYYKISDTAQAVCGNNYYCKNSVRIQCPDGGITNTETASLGSQCYKSGLSCTTDVGFGTNTCNYELTTNDYTDCTECSINKCADGYYMDGNACEICPVGSFCANNVKTLCPPNYTTTDVGAVLKTQCVTTCSDKDVVYGTAYNDTATVLWPAVCTHTYGISVTGNPCKIIDNVCVETSCKYDYEMIDGKCELCVRDNALSFKQGKGNCIVETCLYGYRPFGQSCISDTIECSADGAVAAEQKWNPNTNSFGPCTIIECATGYHIEENSCVLDTQACTIENGTGEKVYDHDLGKWGKCVVSSCLPGYTNNPKLTHETWKPCGRCNNMFGANGERIVSSYLTECEIASCMYQGEKYMLENNECISICDERSDETGSRYWDGNKCVHDCKPGFLKW